MMYHDRVNRLLAWLMLAAAAVVAVMIYFSGTHCYGQSGHPPLTTIGVKLKFLDGSEYATTQPVWNVEIARSDGTRELESYPAATQPIYHDPIYLSAALGMDTNDGSTQTRPKRTLTQATLRRNADTLLDAAFDYSSSTVLSLPDGCRLLAYSSTGATTKPTVTFSGTGQYPAVFAIGSTGASIDGIRINSSSAVPAVGVMVTGKSVTIQNCDAGRVATFINLRSSLNASVIGCYAKFPDNYMIYGQGIAIGGVYVPVRNTLISGNRCDGSHYEHPVRFHNWGKDGDGVNHSGYGLIVRDNVLTCPNADGKQRAPLRIHDGSGGALVSGNTLASGHLKMSAPVAAGPLAGADGGINYPSDPAHLAERNRLLNLKTDGVMYLLNTFDDAPIHIFPGTSATTIDRNKFINMRDAAIQYRDDPQYDPWRAIATITVTNNTVQTKAAFLATGRAKVTHSGNTVNGQHTD